MPPFNPTLWRMDMASGKKQNELNPEVRTVRIGKKEQREVTIYPLSLADERDLTELVVEIFKKVLGQGEGSLNLENMGDFETVETVMDIVYENISKILPLITEEEIHYRELTNSQLSEIAMIVFEVNFEMPGKNFKSLFGRAKNTFLPKGPSQESFVNMPNSGSKTSTESTTGKEESQGAS